MKTYKIFKHPQNKIEAVKLGWSWPAFGLTFIWALWKRMWGVSIGIFAAVIILCLLIDSDVLHKGIGMAVAFLFGSTGNKWRESNLKSRGYDDMGAVTAANPEGAVAIFMKEANQDRVA